MTDLKLYTKITTLPDSLKNEVVDFIDFIITKSKRDVRKPHKGRTFGYAKDAIVLKPGFDDPLEDFKAYS
ncbi:MAG: DUF2281 domain-containing protein [Cyclobacteriaceae bacterium]|nr:DUF2281 domain-containing protein [Cyclobacteriaceae bacterium]